MKPLLIKNVYFNNKLTDILIENNKFSKITPGIECENADIINAKSNLAVVPAFYNTHTHAAMTLLRGYADDLELFDWLNNYIWPAEAKLSEKDIYWGIKLAALEMIHSGTVFFNDMYFYPKASIKACKELGIRACIGLISLNSTVNKPFGANQEECEEIINQRAYLPDTLQIALAPHAVYTVPEAVLRRFAEMSDEYNFMVHTHASETKKEVEDCKAANNGLSPIEYLNSLGLLSKRAVLAHCTHLSNNDIKILKDTNSVISCNVTSNLKLNSGRFRFYDVAEKARCRVTLGTDGASSNNSLSMLSEMKITALEAKLEADSPTAGKAESVFNCACSGAKAFGLNAGEVAEGRCADCLLIELNHPSMTANYNLISNLVYSADSSVINTVICNGRVLMKNHTIEGESEILNEARHCLK